MGEYRRLSELAEKAQPDYAYDIVLAMVDGRLRELRKSAPIDADIKFLTTKDPIGHLAYLRSASFLLVKSIYDIVENNKDIKIRIHFSVSDGVYCTVDGIKVDEAFLKAVEKRMRELVSEDVPFEKRAVHTEQAIKLFHDAGMYDKEKLFRYRRVSSVNIYSIEDFEDYFYGYMVPSTGCLKYFALYLFDEGFVLQLPKKKDPCHVRPFAPAKKLFEVLKESTRWGDMQEIETVGALNDKVTHLETDDLILVQEALQEKRIAEIAEQISYDPKIKIVLIAGPSSSGKTTFSHRLSVQLKANGVKPHPIAVDNFFVERIQTPKDEEGNYNFECLEAVDVNLFKDCMLRLLAGEEVVLPTFNFKKGIKEYNTPPKKLGPNDVLVIEGIHCLNPKMTEGLEDDRKFKIYISALTQLNIDEHNRIPTTDGRLLRRIVRDARTRGHSAKDTIAMWESVRRGEEENIFPYQEEADEMFNSSLIYELAVLKVYIEPLLFSIDKNCPEYLEAKRLLKFLDYFVGIGSEHVPKNSILREFIGGGCFDV